ncbi:MAG: TetR/AcrR family transcriptional regulator [Clostridiales bacterium]|nr:TetR/AcrR family transcriptional regulator [Clostridiales bacterium]
MEVSKLSEAEQTTLERIHAAAKAAFMEYGFKSASLRQIVKTAGVTLGAFYGYYDSKEELFEALVGEQYNHMMTCYRKAQIDFANLPPDEQPRRMSEISGECMHDMLLYAYDHLEEFKLLLCCSEGTRFAGMIDEMVEIEVKGTHDYQDVLNKLGRPSPEIDPRVEHILITGMFNAYFELIIHEMPLRDAENYLQELREFHTAGWKKIMGQ